MRTLARLRACTHTHTDLHAYILAPHTARSLTYTPVGLLSILGGSGSSAEPHVPSPPRAQAGWVSRPTPRLSHEAEDRLPHQEPARGPGAWACGRRGPAKHARAQTRRARPARRARGWTALQAGRRALTDEGHGLAVDDAAGQQVEVVLLAVHHHRVPGIVAPLGTESRLSVREPPGSDHPGRACPATVQAVLTAGAQEMRWAAWGGRSVPRVWDTPPTLDLGSLV